MLKMVFRQNLLYFASLIMFMDGLYFDNDFWTLFLSFYYFHCCCCCFVGVAVVVSGFVILLLLLYIFNKFVLILTGFLSYYFVKLLSIPIIHGVSILFHVIFNTSNFSIMFFLGHYFLTY